MTDECVCVRLCLNTEKMHKMVKMSNQKQKNETNVPASASVSQLGFDWLGWAWDFHTMWERKSCSSVFFVVVVALQAWCYIAHRSQQKSINKIDIDLKAWCSDLVASNDISCRPFLPSLAACHSVCFAHMIFSLNFFFYCLFGISCVVFTVAINCLTGITSFALLIKSIV